MSASIKNRIEKLREEIRQHDHAYYALGEPAVSDRAYDALFADLQKLETEHPEWVTPDSPTQRVGGAPIEGFQNVTHAVPMLSIDNTYDEAALREFDQRVRKGLGGDEFTYVVEPKIDGVAVSLRYDDGTLTLAATRGDGAKGDDITHNVRTIRSVPLRLSGAGVPALMEVRGEIVWPTEDFQAFNAAREKAGEATFANPRNATAGTLKQLDPKNAAGRGLQFIAHGFGRVEPLSVTTDRALFDELRRLGVPISPHRFVTGSIDEIIKSLPEWDKRRRKLPYETDGLVIKVDALDQRDALGSTSRYPRWCIAYKFPPDRAETLLLGVEFQVGKSGAITPVAKLEPVLLGGTTVSNASLHNPVHLTERLGLCHGDTVVIEKAGEIIPQVKEVVQKRRAKGTSKIRAPETCPCCRHPLKYDPLDPGMVGFRCENRDCDADYDVVQLKAARKTCIRCGGPVRIVKTLPCLRCLNSSCRAQLRERLIHFCGRNRMDIEGAGDVVISTLVDQNTLNDYADLYALHEKRQELEQLRLPDQPLGEQSVDQILEGIERIRALPIRDALSKLKLAEPIDGLYASEPTHLETFEDLVAASRTDLAAILQNEDTETKGTWGLLHPSGAEALKASLSFIASPKALKVAGLGPVRIAKLVDHNLVRSLRDMWKLRQKRDELVALPFPNTLGPKGAQNLLRGIEASKSRPLATLLASLNIPNVGATTAELLAGRFSEMDKLQEASEAAIAEIEGIGRKVATGIVRFFEAGGKAAVKTLSAAGVNMAQPKRTQMGGILEGKSLVVTGTLANMGRKEVQDLIKQHGGKVTGSVSKKTDFVVYGDSAGSKLETAARLDVQTLSESEFLELLGR